MATSPAGRAAVPAYIGSDFRDCPPGHRFSLYGAFWQPDGEWKRVENTDAGALQSDISIASRATRELTQRLIRRQEALASDATDAASFEALSTAPFATGLGISHPLENGFAFLEPYGIPYLPGSGVKGSVRRAAEELVDGLFGGSEGWSLEAIDALFGQEGANHAESRAKRGALTFWDVIPRMQGDAMRVDVMTPHQGKYYRGDESPHDSGNPVPIYFLTVPPGSAFTFHVQCNRPLLRKLAPDLVEGDGWQILLRAALSHAFEWVGFGAKTAVGYGAMRFDPRWEQREQQRAEEMEKTRAREAEAERQRQAEAERAAEAARRRAEFEALPPERQQLQIALQAVERFEAAGPSALGRLQKELEAAIKPLRDGAQKWHDSARREEAAALLERAFDLIGWHDTGIKADKRRKQEKKKRDLIAAIRSGPDD